MTPDSARDPAQQRRAVMRTVWLLTVVAVSVFAGFLWTVTHP